MIIQLLFSEQDPKIFLFYVIKMYNLLMVFALSDVSFWCNLYSITKQQVLARLDCTGSGIDRGKGHACGMSTLLTGMALTV